MEALKSKLDNASYQKLNVHKFTDDSLQYVTDAELVKIGITEMGPRLVILSNVAKKKCTSPNASDSTPLAEISQNQLDIRMTQSSPVSGPSKTSKALNEAHTDGRSGPSSTRSEHEPQSVRQTLEEAAKFRKTLYSKLDAGVVPNHRELLHMVRILCAGMVNDLMKNQKYPTFDQKMTLAQKIIETFPILKVTKLSDESPDYSFFFWQNGGRGPNNEHTGLIHNHLRNECKNMSPSKKKYKRTPKRQQVTTVSSEIIEMAQRCAQLEPTSINFNSISRSMADTHDLLLMMVDANKPVNEILNVLPHLKSYNGIMIQKAYERLMPTYNKESNLKQLFARGLLNESGSFSSFQDGSTCSRMFTHFAAAYQKRSAKNSSIDRSGFC